ncbi:MAG: alpha/beta fold hydrolase, partial [Deltaproteobacteria bacterium]|nr:alpha/beta fold hydrolase [Deltaproteobacteria bacterium]
TVMGGSLGGMQALEWAVMYPSMVRSVVPIAISARHSAWCIGLSEAQRQSIFADAAFNGGRYAPDHPPSTGLAAARMMAMCTYRSWSGFDQRFGRARMRDAPLVFQVESYLRHQGAKLVDRFDANTYVTLTRAMDTHDIARDRGEPAEVLGSISCPALVVSIESDLLYPPNEQQELARAMPTAELGVLHGPHGHDAFLIDVGELNRMVVEFRRRHA